MNDQTTILKPLTDVVSAEALELIEQSIQGQEHAYQTLLKIAISATTNRDWTNFKDTNGEDKPDLARSGAAKIALRLGASILLDRVGGKDGPPHFVREDFEDEQGKLYVYTIGGCVQFSNGRKLDEIGTASTRDQFLGMENEKDADGNYVRNEAGKTNKVPVVLHEALQDAKKKAVANFMKRAVTSAIGMGGLSWEDLEKYGITRAGKARADFKSSKPKIASLPPSPAMVKTKDGKRAPFWPYDLQNGERRIYFMEGAHFAKEWITLHKLQPGQKAGQFWGPWSEELWKDAEKQFAHVEAGDAREPGEDR